MGNVFVSFILSGLVLIVIARYLRSSHASVNLTPAVRKVVRFILLACAITISSIFLLRSDEVVDAIGNRFAPGRTISIAVDYDSGGVFGGETLEIPTRHRLGRTATTAIRVLIGAVCIILPLLTWKIAGPSRSKTDRRVPEHGCQ